MNLSSLLSPVDKAPAFQRLQDEHDSLIPSIQVEGLTGVAKAYVLARLFQVRRSPLLVVTYQFDQAQKLLDDLEQFGVNPDELFLLPNFPQTWGLKGDLDVRTMGERIAALHALASGPCIVAGTPEAVLRWTSPPAQLCGSTFIIRAGEVIPVLELASRLTELGYQSETTVARPGQFSRRGGVFDIFPSAATHPVRLDFFGDEIETIREFDVSTQRSTKPVREILITPAREIILDEVAAAVAVDRIREALQLRKNTLLKEQKREELNQIHEVVEEDIARLGALDYFDSLEAYLPCLIDKPATALDYLRCTKSLAPGRLILDEPALLKFHFERFAAEAHDHRQRRFDAGASLSLWPPEAGWPDLVREAAALGFTVLSQLPKTEPEFAADTHVLFSAATIDSYRHRLHELKSDIATWNANGGRWIVVSDQPHRIKEICSDLDLAAADPDEPGNPELVVMEGRLRQGFKLAEAGLAVITDAELFGAARPPIARRRADVGIPISTILDLRVNDFVVHVHHGIGVYRGLVKRLVDSAERDFLLVQYAGADKLYIPADQIDRIQRYVGAGDTPPTINKIGGGEWQRTTRKVKEQARRMAGELIQLYAAREKAERPPMLEDSPWQREMEDAFPYEETAGQLRAIHDVKEDLGRRRPMDRLICGDVGFGKTEVAIRAAFKVLESGKQVAVLCPTTVLAAQHFSTFSERLAAYPVQVGLLSRFRSKADQKQTIDALKDGSVEIVIGTHRILSKDVAFKNLGLVIVDEEQRFGVAHKERLKQLRASIDVMTLTATPIPRTLSMALTGLRDMSVIDDPPSGRVPITTLVREYEDNLVRDAILRELERDGQVYVVHNRIETIYQLARRIQRLIPDARIGVGHGQMSEDELEKVMHDFYAHENDVLVCTTIIENGLDVPNVNTMIVDGADKMGLAQLYQLRGRVGRSNRQAYAYLLYRGNRVLTEDAERRLLAIKEFTALGSGYQVAMRDLEIRGAGNLLGAEQSGAMLSVGFDMYCQLLSQAVAELKGEDPESNVLPPVDLPITANIPTDYIPNEAERIYFYKKMSSVDSLENVQSLLDEFNDRYGDPPREVWNAIAVLELRLKAREAGIASIRGERAEVTVKFGAKARLTAQAVRLLTYMYKNCRFAADSAVFGLKSNNVMDEVEAMVTVLGRAIHEGEHVVRDAFVEPLPSGR